MRNVGVISDTHGLLRPEAVAALAGSDLIIHAGDVCGAEILPELQQIAPVLAVRGNMDWGAAAEALPESRVVDLGVPDGAVGTRLVGPLVYVLHDLEDFDLDPVTSGFRVVVFGHTHRPHGEERDGVLYLNPGSAGPRRPGRPVSVARMRVDGLEVEAEIVELEGVK